MELFNKYVQNFDMKDEFIKLKYYHTMRVTNNARAIARSLNLSDIEVETATKCGLYHDIGRFEQIKRYQTFLDSASFDHGDYGYKVYLEDLKQSNMIVANAIKYHNKFSVPFISINANMYIDITRDADNLDILYLGYSYDEYNLAPDEQISQSVKEAFLNESIIPHEIIKNNLDRDLQKLALIYCLKFDYSFEILKKNNVLEKLKAKYNDKRFDLYFEKLENYIERRCSDVRKKI